MKVMRTRIPAIYSFFRFTAFAFPLQRRAIDSLTTCDPQMCDLVQCWHVP